MQFTPSYIELYEKGELKLRAEKAFEAYRNCNVCPHHCRVDRFTSELGTCLSGVDPVVSSYTLHFGEEPVISGTKGAGNIFFGNCNLKCIFCQNYEISQNYKEEEKHIVSIEKLAGIMIELQEKGAHNIGLVSPTHFVPSILKSLLIAAEKGLKIPIIYNSNGYDSVEMLKLLDGVVDIYLPDIKYGRDEYGRKYSNGENYFTFAKEAVKEMYRQTGNILQIEDGIARRGLIIRHLVLPNDLSETGEVFKFISEELGRDVHLSLMSQYYPVHRAFKEILLNRKLREREYEKALELLDKYGLHKGWVQELDSFEHYRPDFTGDRENPFGNK